MRQIKNRGLSLEEKFSPIYLQAEKICHMGKLNYLDWHKKTPPKERAQVLRATRIMALARIKDGMQILEMISDV